MNGQPRRRWKVWSVLAAVVIGLLVASFLLLQRGVSWRDHYPIVEAHLVEPDRVTLLVSTCNQGPVVDVLSESGDRVEVAVVSTRTIGGPGGNDCQDVVEIQLDGPLGDRPLIDQTSGEPVPVAP